MIDFREAQLRKLAVHKVGNKSRGEGFIASQTLYDIEEDTRPILEDYFLKPFKAEEFFRFSHESSLDLNEMYNYCGNLFNGDDFLEQSVHMLKHLYLQTTHPQISRGEFYVAKFKDCIIDGQELEAIGVFKSENKEVFLQFGKETDDVHMRIEQGVSTKKLDKGCLIFNAFNEDGYSALMVDNLSEEAAYWKDYFLHIERIQDNSFQTETYLNLARDFCEEVVSQDADKKEQLMFLNKSLNYFTSNETFDADDFRETVIEDPEQKAQFDSYREDFEDQQGIDHETGFAISKYAIRNQRKHFKNLIKLDTQIQIQLNNKNAEEAAKYLERGFDEKVGMYYYKVYFNGEVD